MTKNQTRANIAKLIIQDYTDENWREDGRDGLADDVVNVLTNLRHLCWEDQIDFDSLVTESEEHFEAELEEDELAEPAERSEAWTD